MPGSGDDPTPARDVTLDRYVERIAQAIDVNGGDVWLVGHAMGGVAITAAAERAADHVRGLIYIAAILPRDGVSGAEAVGDGVALIMPKLTLASEGLITVQDDAVTSLFYGSCADADAAWAAAKLRPQAGAITSSALTLTAERYMRVPRYYIECLRDQAILPGAQAAMHQQAGVDGVFALDTDHSPFLSYPVELAAILGTIVSGVEFGGGRVS